LFQERLFAWPISSESLRRTTASIELNSAPNGPRATELFPCGLPSDNQEEESMQPQPGQGDLANLKQRMRASWMAGDFGQVARCYEKGAADFAGRIGIKPGAKVLDIACGTGNQSIPAARAKGKVIGVDIAPNLLEQARKRAAAEGLDIVFEEGDAEQLPYAGGQFDVVLSMFGAMFAPRPERAAAEMLRVCARGGTIAMANWTREGFTGKMFAMNARYIPPPEGIASPLLWGDENTVEERLGDGTSTIKMTRQRLTFEFPFGPRQVVLFFREHFGPINLGYARLDAAGQAGFTAEMEKLWMDHNQGGEDQTRVSAEYLEVLATRA
jgi:SAM-dependent methyltransferase